MDSGRTARKQTGYERYLEFGGIAHKAPMLAICGGNCTCQYCTAAYQCICRRISDVSGLFRFNVWYTAVAGMSIILAAVYTLNMIKNVFYGNTNTLTEKFREITVNQRVILAVIVVLVFMVGVYPGPMFQLVEQTTDVNFKKNFG